MKTIQVKDRTIGEGHPCFIIAEAGSNHDRKLEQAFRLIDIAKDAGADAVKFQTYTPDTITIDSDNRYFRIKHPKWGGQALST